MKETPNLNGDPWTEWDEGASDSGDRVSHPSAQHVCMQSFIPEPLKFSLLGNSVHPSFLKEVLYTANVPSGALLSTAAMRIWSSSSFQFLLPLGCCLLHLIHEEPPVGCGWPVQVHGDLLSSFVL